MRLIAVSKLREAASSYPDVSNQIEDFYHTIKTVHWQNLIGVKKTHAIKLGKRFNVDPALFLI